MVKRVFFIGFMGSGKTTIGQYVANDMGWKFIDMDQYFEAKHECTISEFFSRHGEAAFRQAESQVIDELARLEKIVVATGGGAPCYADNMQKMKAAGVTIYINVEPDELAKRLKSATAHRPLIAGKTAEELPEYIKSKLDERQPFYRQAHIIADGSALPFHTYRTLIEMFPEDMLND